MAVGGRVYRNVGFGERGRGGGFCGAYQARGHECIERSAIEDPRGFRDQIRGFDAEPGEGFAADRPAARQGAAPCLPVQVLASLENADTVRSLAASYTSRPRDVDGRCVRVDVRAEESGAAEMAAATGFRDEPPGARPTVWLPDSSAWLRIAHRASGSSIPAAGTSVAKAAVVVAMPAPLAAAIGWRARPPSWAAVFAAAADSKVWARLGHPGWGAFKLGKTSPLTSTSGLLALVASFAVSNDAWTGLTPAEVQSPSALAEVAKTSSRRVIT